MCNATATNVLHESGWHYFTCHQCSKKVVGDDCNFWCTKCEAKVDMFMFHFEVDDRTGTTIFIAPDSEVQKLVRQTEAELITASE
ncbi:hypothetical protein MKX01_038394, partial [Papaver californicum]